MTSPLVSTQWLSDNMGDKNLRIVDASWYLPHENRNATDEFNQAHIPGAIFFEIDKILDTSIDLPHMVAPPAFFAQEVGKLGISETDTIIIYDGSGLRTSARAWWNFKIMGAKDVRVLNGGFPKWQAENRAITSEVPRPQSTIFTASFESQLVASSRDVSAAIDQVDVQIVDMRSRERFDGTAPEPCVGLKSGHMPNALNLPFTELVSQGQLRSPDEIRAVLNQHDIDTGKPIISSCGSGITATLLNLALASIGVDVMRVYDGSWAEWGAHDRFPIQTKTT